MPRHVRYDLFLPGQLLILASALDSNILTGQTHSRELETAPGGQRVKALIQWYSVEPLTEQIAKVWLVSGSQQCVDELHELGVSGQGAAEICGVQTDRRRRSRPPSTTASSRYVASKSEAPVSKAPERPRRQPNRDTVFIYSEPEGARVEVDGQFIGTTPLAWAVGNWALNPSKAWLTSRHLSKPLVMTILMDGYLSKTIRLTGDPLFWTSMNGVNSYTFYVIQSTEYRFKLDRSDEFLSANSHSEVEKETALATENVQVGIEAMIRTAMNGIVTVVNSTGGHGSGFFVTASGVVVSNKHVIGVSDRVRVVTSNGKSYDSSAIFVDPEHDLALIKVPYDNSPALQLAKPSSIGVGQDVIAIGSPGLGQLVLPNTVTRGIVSAIRRLSSSGHVYVQTDANINPGNSGGPLLNKWGHVVGVNTLKLTAEGYSGLNFAIGSENVLGLLDRRFGFRAIQAVPPASSGGATGAHEIGGQMMGNEDVVRLVEAGVSEKIIVSKIEASPANFRLNTEDLIYLKQHNVGESVIAAMLRRVH